MNELPLVNKPLACPTIVGREIELAALHTIVDEVEGGHSRVVLLSGEAGIGKSRLVAALETEARSRGVTVLQGNCFQRDLTSPYAPLIDLVRSSVAHQPLEVREATFQPFAQEFFPLLPDLVTHPPTPAALPTPEPEQEQRRLLVALTAFFTKLAAGHPLLFAIEDIHWCDESSLEFLQYFMRHSTSFPSLVLLAYRADELSPALTNWLAQQDRERRAREFSLARLTRSDVEAMLTAIFDLDPATRSELLNTLYSLTEGNPFFVEEVLSSLRAAGGIFYAEGAWRSKRLENLHIPRSIQAAVRQRSERLSEAARELLALAAVAGRRFDIDLLLSVTRQTEDQLLNRLKELIAAQLVIEESADRFVFRHALTREAIYADLLGRERKALHRSIADTMERLYASVLDVHLADLVYHFSEAGVWEKAFAYAQRAGEKSLSFYAPRAAIDSFTHALTATYQLSLPPPSSLFLARGQAHEALGEFDRARADYEAALQGARSTGENRPEWEALLHLGMLWAGRDYERSGEHNQYAFELARTLDDPSITARSLNRLGNWHLNVEHPRQALAHHQEALKIFQRLEDQPGIAETLDLLGMTSYLGGDLLGGTSYYEQAVALFRRLDDWQGLASSLATLTMRGITYQTDTMVPAVTHVSAVTADGELALKIARETEQRAAEAYALIFLAFCLGPQGEYTQALEYAGQGLHIAEEIDHRQWMTAAHCALGALYRDLFALPQARQHLEQALHLANETCSLHWIRTATGHLASTYVVANAFHEAETVLQAALPPTTPAQTLGQRLVWCAHAELALARKEPSQALQLIEQLLTSAANTSEGRDILRLSRLRGEALTALNRASGAEELLQHARKAAQQQGALPLLWRLHLSLGKCYQAQRRYEAAEESFFAARDLLEQLASNVPGEPLRANFLEHTHSLLSLKPPSPKRAEKRAYDRLTARERIEQELRTAQLIQRSLLPEALPRLSGWQLTTYYQPAREVGGDFYDFIPFEDGRLGLLIGDATGKGIPAALVMTTTCTMLRTAAQATASPSEVLARVNDLLYARIPSGMFVTCFYTILDPRSERLRYANAGQDLPYRCHSNGVSELRATGMPLGLMPGSSYEEQEVTVAPGESILFYSDGLVEAHNPSREMFGFPRLQTLLAEHADGASLIDFLLGELKRFTSDGWEQEDDVTLLLLQRMAESAPA